MDLGVSLLLGVASASVFLEVDGYGALNLGPQSLSNASQPTDMPSNPSPPVVTTMGKLPPSIESSELPKTTGTTILAPAPQKRDVILTHERRDASDSYDGCVDVKLGVKIVAGAEGRLLWFWNVTASFDVFAEEWTVFNVSHRILSYEGKPELIFPTGMLQWNCQTRATAFATRIYHSNDETGYNSP